LRYLLGSDVDDFRCKSYARVRKHCETSGDGPWQAMNKLSDGVVAIPHTKPLIDRFKLLTDELAQLEAVKDDVQAFIDTLLPDGEVELAELRKLALDQMEGAVKPADLLAGMMQEITQPDIPPTVEEVRLMSLHKSKGLSSPYVFVAGCVEGILPPASEPEWSKDEKDAALEEARRLFYVGITRVKADPNNGRPGSLFISYPQKMTVKDAYGANVAFKTKGRHYGETIAQPLSERAGPDRAQGRRGLTAVASRDELYQVWHYGGGGAEILQVRSPSHRDIAGWAPGV
jgi:DNA helicase II / ATP-dependent DNA helicase PcrA